MEDKELIYLKLSEEEIKSMKKEKFRTIVRDKMKDAPFKSLNQIKENHSKMNGLMYESKQHT